MRSKECLENPCFYLSISFKIFDQKFRLDIKYFRSKIKRFFLVQIEEKKTCSQLLICSQYQVLLLSDNSSIEF